MALNDMIKRRSMPLQVLWSLLTFGLYPFYWYHVTTLEMANYLGRKDEPVLLWSILLGIPPVFFYSYYKEGELYEQLTHGALSRWVIFTLWIVFAPAVWFIIQSKLNEIADAGQPPALTPTSV